MAYEIVQITSWTTSAGSITNPTYAYDNGAVGSGPVTGTSASSYTNTNDTSYANQSSALSTTQYTLTSSGMSAKSRTWTSSTLYVTYTLITAGDGDITQWDSFAELNYCTDGSTFSNTIAGSSQDNNTGRVTFSVALGANPTLANIKIQALLTGHGKTGSVPDIIAASAATCYLYHAYVEGVYTELSVTNLNSNSYCNIGSSYNITGVGLTGSTAVTVNGVAASFSVTNSTTILVTIPPMTTFGAVTVSVTNGTTASCTGYINTPTITTSPSGTKYVSVNGNFAVSGTTTNDGSNNVSWYQGLIFGTLGSFLQPTTVSGSNNVFYASGVATQQYVYAYASSNYPNTGATLTVIVEVNPTPAISASTTSPLYGATNVTISTTSSNVSGGSTVGTSGYGTNDIWTGTANANLTNLAVQPSGFITAKTYYLRTTNLVPVNADASITITPQTVSISAPTPNGYYMMVGHTRTFTAGSVSGASNTTVNWSATGGSFSPTSTASGGTTTYTAPGTPGTYTIYNTAAANGSTQSSCTVYVAALPAIANNGPVLLNTNVTLTPTFNSGVSAATVTPGTWGAWTSGVGQAVSLPYNKVYTISQTDLSGTANVSTVPQAKLPVTPAASISMSQVRQIVTGGGSGSMDMNDSSVRILSSTSNLSQISFSQLSGTYLPTTYNW